MRIYHIGDIVEIRREGQVIVCRVDRVPTREPGSPCRYGLTALKPNAGTFEESWFGLSPHKGTDNGPTLDECKNKFDGMKVDRAAFAKASEVLANEIRTGVPARTNEGDYAQWDPLRMCVRCDKSIRAGIVGIDDHVEGCPGRATYETKPGHMMSERTLQAGRTWVGLSKSELETTRELACFALLATLPDVDPETPGRMARALTELTSGYGADLKAILKTFPRGDADSGIVIVRDIPFASVCEHHVLPFTGTVTVAYLPSDRIVGLSKIPRLVDVITRRLQVQERIGALVSDALMEHVGAKGVMVVIKSKHTCMTLRGARCPGEMVTSTIRGVFEHEASARAEVLSLIGM